MSNKLTTLEDFMKKYISNQKLSNNADSFDIYKHKNGIDYDKSYSNAVQSLYAKKKKDLATYGKSYRDISNMGLQNSGYLEYINNKSDLNYSKKLDDLRSARDLQYTKALGGYASYLQKYTDKQTSLKKNVMSHLINNDVVNLDDAIEYGLSQGLSNEDAIAVGNNAYSITKQKVFNNILEQAASLGLDRDGAVMLAKKMGVTDGDAEEFGNEIEEMLKHYKNLSSDYIEYLENKAGKTTNTFD